MKLFVVSHWAKWLIVFMFVFAVTVTAGFLIHFASTPGVLSYHSNATAAGWQIPLQASAKRYCSCRFVMEGSKSNCLEYSYQPLPAKWMHPTIRESSHKVTASHLLWPRASVVRFVSVREGCRNL